ncbi:sialate O-acetylesterase [Thalassobellus sediminis]|uniref:sialate O-acetylesterase n=1 Tax=Thalassobellus sediminis TaxID=3367753 RepID=UPI00378B633D
MKYIITLLIAILLISFKSSENEERTKNFPKEELRVINIPKKENVWVFIMAGQSNMAGRGFVEPKDTIHNNQILSINSSNQLIYAKEPLHFYEPPRTGLDIGMSFGKEIIKKIPDSISVLLIPTAVGGSSIGQWIENKKRLDVELFSNFKEKIELAQNYGVIKGILWHQGETDTDEEATIKEYDKNLSVLISKFREATNNDQLPVIIGELGDYSKYKEKWNQLNSKILEFSKTDSLVRVVKSKGLKDKGDKLHFDSKSIRLFGKRYAKKFFELITIQNDK